MPNKLSRILRNNLTSHSWIASIAKCRKLWDDWKGEGKKLIEHNFDFAVAREGLEIVKALQQQVQERVTQAASFSGLVENLKSYYNKQEELQQEINQDELSGEAIFEEKDIEEYTNALLSDIDSLKSVSAQITAALGRGNSLGVLSIGIPPRKND